MCTVVNGLIINFFKMFNKYLETVEKWETYVNFLVTSSYFSWHVVWVDILQVCLIDVCHIYELHVRDKED